MRFNVTSEPMGSDETQVQTVLIVSMTTTSSDVRILRHINALRQDFQIITMGYGGQPVGVKQHIEMPKHLPYLPLNLRALLPHVLQQFELSSQYTAAIQFASEAIGSLQFDLALLNDVQTLPLMEQLSTPTIVDMHEYAPREMDDDWRFRLFLMRYYTWLCATYLPRARSVCTVSQTLASEYSRNFGVDVKVIQNARESRDLQVRETQARPLRLVHAGLAASSRKLERMIDAIDGHPDYELDLYLVPAPRQASYARLKNRVRSSNNVRVVSPVPAHVLPETLNEYDLSLIFMSSDSFSVRHCMPNKLFDSIQARVGIVASPLPDVKDFVDRYEVGVSAEDFSAGALRECLEKLNIEQVNSFKVACDSVAKRINAESEAVKLRNLIRSSR